MGVVKYSLRESFDDFPVQSKPAVTEAPPKKAVSDLEREAASVLAALKSSLPDDSSPEDTTDHGEPSPVSQKPSKVHSSAEVSSPLPVEGTNAEKQLRFNLGVWHPRDDLLVICDLHDATTAPAEQQQLLVNILVAIDRLPERGMLPGCEPLPWPGNSNTGSESAAREMLSMFLASRIKSRGVCWVLLMGEAANNYLVEGDKIANSGDSVQLPGGATGLVLPSLSDMLQEPDLKRITWQTIRHLAAEF